MIQNIQPGQWVKPYCHENQPKKIQVAGDTDVFLSKHATSSRKLIYTVRKYFDKMFDFHAAQLYSFF